MFAITISWDIAEQIGTWSAGLVYKSAANGISVGVGERFGLFDFERGVGVVECDQPRRTG